MKQWLKISLPGFFLGFAILIVSVFRTAAVRHEFSGDIPERQVLDNASASINYSLAYPGSVLPDSPLWWLKAGRDKLWLTITTNPDRKAELMLLFADKRLNMAMVLFDKGNFELGFSTLSKAEKYLEAAAFLEEENRRNGSDTSEFLKVLAIASLKHREVIESLIAKAPEGASPFMASVGDYSKNSFESAMHGLNEKGIPVPESPFDTE